MSDDDIFQTLVHLGLSNSQARVYRVMTEAGVAKASALWKRTKVGRQDIYRVLNELQKVGLVEKVINAPTEYQAIPLAEGISMLFQRMKDRLSNLRTEAIKLVETQRANTRATLFEQYQVVMIPEKDPFLLRAKQAFNHAQRSISTCSTLKRLSLSLTSLPYAEAIKRGVQVRIIANAEDKSCFAKLKQPFSTKSNFRLKRIFDPGAAAYSICDEKDFFIATSSQAGFLEVPCLYSNNPAIVKLLVGYFDMQWNTAQEVQV